VPDPITPGQYKLEIAQRIQFFKDVVKTNKIVL